MNAPVATSSEAPPPKAGGPTEFTVNGMTCQGCVRHVTEAVRGVAGVSSAVVSLEARRATVRWAAEGPLEPAAVISAIRAAGFEAALLDTGQDGERPGRWAFLNGWGLNVVLGPVCLLPLLVGEWVLGLGMERWFQWFAFALAVPVQGLCGARFYRGAFNQIKVGNSNMDTLVALGSTTAFLYSVWGLFAGWHAHLYFMEAVGIITLVSVGHWLEAKASDRAASSLRALLNLAPQTARRLDSAGIELEVPAASLKVDDRVLLKPGDRIPTDGEVAEGHSAVDESMLTGESLPVEKVRGAKLYAGTVNQSGRLVLRVTATGEGTALANIIAVVQRAQTSRADIQRLGDKVSSVFVPIVVLVAVATGLWWGLALEQARSVHNFLMPHFWHVPPQTSALAAAVIHAAAVLIVACPCAMGLATPAAIMAGANAAARRGILIRDGHALEKTGRLTAVLFDKTGTLTQGNVDVAAVKDLRTEGTDTLRLESIAAALARPSNHPLSQAVARLGPDRESAVAVPAPKAHRAGCCADAMGPGSAESPKVGVSSESTLALTHWRELRGQGVEAHSSHGLLRLGSLSWLGECGVELDPAGLFLEEWTAQGATVLGLAVEHRLMGVVALRDTLKPHAAGVIARLKSQGKEVYLVTGDNQRTAAAIASQTGIPAGHVFAEVRPEQKCDIVRRLQESGHRVAFVGDGINDAPALEQSDLGIAVSRASDVAREAADIILLRSDIDAIPEALGLAQATLRTIKQNLFWAFFYNAAGIPLAALGFLSPILCAAAMGLSDLVVIGNALRLRHWKSDVSR